MPNQRGCCTKRSTGRHHSEPALLVGLKLYTRFSRLVTSTEKHRHHTPHGCLVRCPLVRWSFSPRHAPHQGGPLPAQGRASGGASSARLDLKVRNSIAGSELLFKDQTHNLTWIFQLLPIYAFSSKQINQKADIWQQLEDPGISKISPIFVRSSFVLWSGLDRSS